MEFDQTSCGCFFRDDKGHTQARRAADMRGIKEFMRCGATLGNLWMEGHFEVGDPHTASGGPKDMSGTLK